MEGQSCRNCGGGMGKFWAVIAAIGRDGEETGETFLLCSRCAPACAARAEASGP